MKLASSIPENGGPISAMTCNKKYKINVIDGKICFIVLRLLHFLKNTFLKL